MHGDENVFLVKHKYKYDLHQPTLGSILYWRRKYGPVNVD